jgi:hypothetical protein
MVIRLRFVRLVLAALQLACATTDALTSAQVRFFDCFFFPQYELRPLPSGSSPVLLAHHFDLTIPPPTTRQAQAAILFRAL